MKNEFRQVIKFTSKILDYWLPYKIRYEWTPSISVGILYDGKAVYKKGFGFADIDKKIPASSKTCYRIASISKTFTSLAIFQLVEKGKLSLDDKIEKYIPWFKTENMNSENISIRQVLSHTAGVLRDGTTDHWLTDNFPDRSNLKKSINKNSIIFENLTRFKYSNFGYALLGEVIRNLSGLDYIEYTQKNIINKLDMKNTKPDYVNGNDDILAFGYSKPYEFQKRECYPKNTETKVYAPATGFVSNVDDLLKYLSGLTFNVKNSNSLVSKEAKKEMFREHWKIPGEENSYGLGFIISQIEKRKRIGHTGGFAGFETMISLDNENDLGVITLSNGNGSPNALINKSIFETVYMLIDNKGKYWGGKKIENIERYQGLYRSRFGIVAIVSLDANLFAFSTGIDSPLKGGVLLKPKGENKFLIDSANTFDSEGELVSFKFLKNEKKPSKMICGSNPMKRIG